MADIESLRRQFDVPGVEFAPAGDGLIKVVVRNAAATAEVYLLGATVTHFQPHGQARPVLFVSSQSNFKPDKAIRGGIPVCWPWFGPHPSDGSKPQHGLVRAREWTLASVTAVDPETTQLRFEIDAGDGSGASAVYTVTVGRTLQLSLKSLNRGDAPVRLEEALHTYFTVGDSRQVTIDGLAQTEFIDKTAGGQRKRQGDEPISFAGETDRVYLNTQSACVLVDPVLKRTITVNKTGSKSTVVWNPWVEKSKALADFGDDEWQQMCCIETANAADNALTLPPKTGEHEVTVEIGVV